MKERFGLLVLTVLMLGLSSCATNTGRLAPVMSIYAKKNFNGSTYRVRAGDTLYSVSWAYGVDFRDLARWNGLKPPYRLYVNEVLRLTSTAPAGANKRKSSRSSHRSGVSYRKSSHAEKTRHVSRYKGRWVWPVKGKVIRKFQSRFGGNQGIDIKGQYNSLIKASAAGVVVYSGAGVRGYGNLIIIEHSPSVLSAYAFNRIALVKVGQRVKVGSYIARMGRNAAGIPAVHFEIRVNGKPVNPQIYVKG